MTASSGITLEHGPVRIEFDPARGKYDIACAGFVLRGCSAGVRLGNRHLYLNQWRVVQKSESEICLAAEAAGREWRFKLALRETRAGQVVRVDMSGEIPEGATDVEIMPLVTGPLTVDHVLVHGRRMGGCDAIVPGREGTREYESSFFNCLTLDSTTCMLSHPLVQEQPAYVCGKISGGRLDELSVLTRIDYPAGRTVEAIPLTIMAGRDGHAMLQAWAMENTREERNFACLEAGWNSWDYYRWTISEEEVLNNARFIAADPVLSKYVKRIIVDDGWQYCYGEWDANPRFPSGMEYLARELRSLGFEPGLWFAPTIVEPHAQIAQMDYDMLACGLSGEPCLAYACMQRLGFVLDPTRDKVRKWLYDLFARYADMGYTYFKLDFLWQTLKAPRFHDLTVPKGRIMELVTMPIREATRGRAKILGCNYQLEGGGDYVDLVRTSGDIHAVWDAVKNNVGSISSRYWSHNRFWINDPDFALCRSRETADDPDLERLKPCLVGVTPDMKDAGACGRSLVDIDIAGLQVLLSLVVVSGGAVNLSDNLPRLNPAGLNLARKVVAAAPGDAGIPLDLFKSKYPRQWVQQYEHGQRVLVINWENEPARVELDLAGMEVATDAVRDFWQGGSVDHAGGVISLDLAPRSCRLFECG